MPTHEFPHYCVSLLVMAAFILPLVSPSISLLRLGRLQVDGRRAGSFLADILDNLLHWTATDFAFLNLSRAPVDEFVPLLFRVSVPGSIKLF